MLEVPSSVSRGMKAVTCLTEKICVSDQALFRHDLYSAVGPEFNVNESMIYVKFSVFRQKHRCL